MCDAKVQNSYELPEQYLVDEKNKLNRRRSGGIINIIISCTVIAVCNVLSIDFLQTDNS